MDFPIFEYAIKGREITTILEANQPAIRLIENISNDDEALERIYDEIFIEQKIYNTGKKPYAIPLHFCKEDPEIYFYFTEYNLGSLDIDPAVMFRSFFDTQTFTSYREVRDKVLYKICDYTDIDLIMPRFILGSHSQKDLITIYLKTEPIFTKNEYDKIIKLAGGDLGKHSSFLKEIFGEDVNVKQSLIKKAIGLGIAYDGEQVLNKINYYFLFDKLTDTEKENIERLTGVQLKTSDGRLPKSYKLHHIGVSFSRDDIKYTKLYYRQKEE